MNPCILDSWLAAQLPSLSPTASAQDFVQALKKEQWQRIQNTLSHAKQNSSFYGKHLQGFAIEQLTPEQFSTIPLTTAADLQNSEQLLCVSQSEIARMVTLQSSGTTALPKRLAFSHEDLEDTKDFFAHGMTQLVQSGQRLLTLWPGAMRPNGVSALLRDALTKNGVEVFAGEALTTEQSLSQELTLYNPHVIVAAPRQLAILATLLEKDTSQKGALCGILASAEFLPPELEQRLQHLGLLVLDHYGITEAGYGGGVECFHKHGYHLRELHLFIEILHPVTLQPVPYGQEGEIVLTTLTRKAMPLIRYRTGDVACLLQGPCPCGSPLSRLARVQGRLMYTEQGYTIEHCAKGAFNERTTNLTL